MIFADTVTVRMQLEESRGPQGEQGVPGRDGYTPVKGKDYFTDADKDELARLVLAQITDASEVGM